MSCSKEFGCFANDKLFKRLRQVSHNQSFPPGVKIITNNKCFIISNFFLRHPSDGKICNDVFAANLICVEFIFCDWYIFML